MQGCLFIAVLNQIRSQHPISLQKIILRQKPERMRIVLLYSPIFRLTGRVLEGASLVVIVIQLKRENVVVCFW